MIAVAVAAIAISWLRGTLPIAKSAASRLWWIPLAAIPIVVFLFLFPISRPLWLLLPEMRFLQYPWRWLEAVEAPMAIFFVTAIWPSGRRARATVLVALRRGLSCVYGLRGEGFLPGLLSRRHRRFGALRLPCRRGL